MSSTRLTKSMREAILASAVKYKFTKRYIDLQKETNELSQAVYNRLFAATDKIIAAAATNNEVSKSDEAPQILTNALRGSFLRGSGYTIRRVALAQNLPVTHTNTASDRVFNACEAFVHSITLRPWQVRTYCIKGLRNYAQLRGDNSRTALMSADEVAKAESIEAALIELRNDMIVGASNIEQVLAGCRSVKQLVAMVPELKPHIPENQSKSTVLVPVELLVNVRKLLA